MKYQDKWLRLVTYPVLAFVIRHFGDMTPWGQLLKQPLYYADLLWDMLIVIASWEANRRLIIYLDRHYSWVTQKFQRFVIQFFTALPMTFIIVIPMIYLWNEIIIDRGGFDTANLLVNDVPLIIIFTGMVHMIYTFLYYHQHYSQTIEGLEARIKELETSVAGVSKASDLLRPSGYRELLIVNYGNSSVPLHTHTIAFIFKQNELSFIKTFDGKEYTSSSSLDALEELLDPTMFFRLNRQMLGNIKSIKQFKSDNTGKLILTLEPATDEEVTVSKKKAAEFREWIGSKV
ncbi:MAG: LytTR family transcriptional regulator DNA-binding domain-containing protein [Cyclobacteriaceae bacterium]|jgi:hypothetical protein|nr:LytTR family transcriptional regulator DNA-binding domain-containing protein [Cyclobacteriaceae bacterium]